MTREPIHIIGGGLAGTEAAWQIARRGLQRRAARDASRRGPRRRIRPTGWRSWCAAIRSRPSRIDSAPWLLKEELRRLDSLLLAAAQKARVPGGHALTVDRDVFAAEVTAAIAARAAHRTAPRRSHQHSRTGSSIIATGPLTSDALAAEIARLTGSDRLFFYDSISPIVDADTVDTSIAFWASRYGKSHRRHRRLPELPVQQRSSTSAFSTSC